MMRVELSVSTSSAFLMTLLFVRKTPFSLPPQETIIRTDAVSRHTDNLLIKQVFVGSDRNVQLFLSVTKHIVEKYDMARRDAVLPDIVLYLNVIDCAVWAVVSLIVRSLRSYLRSAEYFIGTSNISSRAFPL